MRRELEGMIISNVRRELSLCACVCVVTRRMRATCLDAAALRRRRDEMGPKHSPWCKFVDECEPVDDGHGDGVHDGGCHDLGHQRGGSRE